MSQSLRSTSSRQINDLSLGGCSTDQSQTRMVFVRFPRPGCPDATPLKSCRRRRQRWFGVTTPLLFPQTARIYEIPRCDMMDGGPFLRFGLSLLGRFELTGPDGTVDLPSKKLAGLLAYLACTAPQPQSREKLSALLWGSHFDAQARQNLRQSLFRLRKVLGQDALQGDGEFVALSETAVLCDVGRFEALVREGSRDALSAAADLYRGRFIDDVSVPEEGWNEWLTGERDRLQELALGAMVRLGEQELAAGRAEHALKAGQRAIALNNMREDAHRLIVQALAATGRKAEALKHYQDLVALLKRELNTGPDAATRSLVAELRTTEPPSRSPAVKPALPEPDRPSIVVLPVGNMRRDHGKRTPTT